MNTISYIAKISPPVILYLYTLFFTKQLLLSRHNRYFMPSATTDIDTPPGTPPGAWRCPVAAPIRDSRICSSGGRRVPPNRPRTTVRTACSTLTKRVLPPPYLSFRNDPNCPPDHSFSNTEEKGIEDRFDGGSPSGTSSLSPNCAQDDIEHLQPSAPIQGTDSLVRVVEIHPSS